MENNENKLETKINKKKPPELITRDFFYHFVSSFIWISILIIIFDQVAKWAVYKHFNGVTGTTEALIPGFLNLTLTYNEGAFLSLGSGQLWSRILFIIISLAAAIAIPFYYIKKRGQIRWDYRFVLSFVLGGCIGNLIDRAFYWKGTVGFSGVIDFLTFAPLSNGKTLFGIWNIADAMIVFSVVFIVIDLIVEIILDLVKSNKAKQAKIDVEVTRELPIDMEDSEKIIETKNEIETPKENSIKSANSELASLLSQGKSQNTPKENVDKIETKIDSDTEKKKTTKSSSSKKTTSKNGKK